MELEVLRKDMVAAMKAKDKGHLVQSRRTETGQPNIYRHGGIPNFYPSPVCPPFIVLCKRGRNCPFVLTMSFPYLSSTPLGDRILSGKSSDGQLLTDSIGI